MQSFCQSIHCMVFSVYVRDYFCLLQVVWASVEERGGKPGRWYYWNASTKTSSWAFESAQQQGSVSSETAVSASHDKCTATTNVQPRQMYSMYTVFVW
jgi:hypothetical protein